MTKKSKHEEVALWERRIGNLVQKIRGVALESGASLEAEAPHGSERSERRRGARERMRSAQVELGEALEGREVIHQL